MAGPKARFSTKSSLAGPSAMEVLDEAVSLIRQTPPATLSLYYLGALPFCLTLIYFWFDMTQGADALAHLPGEALTLTGLYFWMKICQAVFARKLLTLLEGQDEEPWTLPRWANTALLQVIYAGSFVLAYPLAVIVAVPYGWVTAFYHNISIVATGPKSTVRSSYAEAAELARLWPKQNHFIIGILLAAVFVLFLNFAVFFMMLPQLLNMFFGIETVFDENTYAWNNSSFYLDVSVFCFLVLNPLNKAIYALRCFYGRARLNGADLKSALRRYQAVRPTSARAPVLAMVVMLALVSMNARAQTAAPVAPAPVIEPAEAPVAPPAATPAPAGTSAVTLDQAIQKTLQKDEFAWRLPRAATKEEEQDGWLARSTRSMMNFLRKIFHTPAQWIKAFFKWLFSGEHKRQTTTGTGWQSMAELPWKMIFFLFAGLAVLLLVFWVVRYFLRRTAPVVVPQTMAAVRTVDLEAEDVQADALPEDSWLALAQQMIERGEMRLALRAFYLATLSVLAQQQLVRLAPAKSNRDYLVELARRLRGEVAVLEFFRENSRLFEASWYGTHDVTSAIIETMRANHQQVRSHAPA